MKNEKAKKPLEKPRRREDTQRRRNRPRNCLSHRNF